MAANAVDRGFMSLGAGGAQPQDGEGDLERLSVSSENAQAANSRNTTAVLSGFIVTGLRSIAMQFGR